MRGEYKRRDLRWGSNGPPHVPVPVQSLKMLRSLVPEWAKPLRPLEGVARKVRAYAGKSEFGVKLISIALIIGVGELALLAVQTLFVNIR